jgi:hypothetical protein
MNDKIKWSTCLGSAGQSILVAASVDGGMSDYQKYRVKNEIDKLTVPELREVSQEFDLEIERLEELLEHARYAKTAIRKEAGL